MTHPAIVIAIYLACIFAYRLVLRKPLSMKGGLAYSAIIALVLELLR